MMRWWQAVLAVMVVTAVVAWVRAAHESSHYFERGQAAVAEDRVSDAVLEFRRAAQWYSPGAATPRAAIDELIRIGDGARDGGDLGFALEAWRSARIAIFATRWLRVPHADALPALHERISVAMATQVASGGPPQPADVEEFRQQLDGWRERHPSPALGGGASLAFFVWLGCLGMLAWRGLDAEGQLQRRQALQWGSASVLSGLLWVVLVRLA